ncbi:MAG: hypothetical protein Q9216_005893 [Gyalolechia sp. 2 TL-2023]
MGTTVTIDKSYFETLLRRAEFILIRGDHGTGVIANTFSGGQIGTGIGQFSTNQGPDTFARINPSISKRPVTPVALRHAPNSPFSELFADQKSFLQHPGSSGYEDVYYGEKDESVSLHTPRSEQASIPKMDQRTVIFKNLADRTTHRDIVNVVRGGMLVDVYIRSPDKSANVSFVHGSAAQEFMAYVKRNDVCIHGRRITFAWGDRQYILPGYLANKIGIGATRNLLIRRVYPSITEKRLEEDLEHIHNLVIIDISQIHGDVYLSLNSIRSSLFARTCMMSRALYKGLQIEWYPDECALPLPKPPGAVKKEKCFPPNTNEHATINRFQLLNTGEDATEDGSSLGDEDGPTTTSGFSPLQKSRRRAPT